MDKHTLRKLQLIQIGILCEFEKICIKHSISFYLISGTLLGAIKYSGFIPWDDDIDVGLLRSDYDKLLHIMGNDLTTKYFLHNYKTDEEFPLSYSKLRIDGTEMSQWYDTRTKHKGIFIDIFPLDYVPNNKILIPLFCFIHKSISALIFAKNVNEYGTSTIKRSFIWILSNFFSTDFLKLLQNKFLLKQNKYKSVANLFNSWGATKETFPYKWFEDFDYAIFEGRKMPIPGSAKLYLEKVYGDFTKDPPIDEQISHHEFIKIDFGDY